MAHRFVPRKGPRKDKDPAPNESPAPPPPPKDDDDDATAKDLLGKDLLGKDSLLGKLVKRSERPEEPALPRARKFQRREISSGGISWLWIAVIGIAGAGLAGGLIVGYIKSQVPGYVQNAKVQGPSRLDWLFVLERKSTDPPPLWTSFDSVRQSNFELYVPPSHETSTQTYPLVLFLSPTSAKAIGWKPWSTVCRENEILFAGVKNAGPERPSWQRVRMILDVLDDIRKKYRVDPDRTYLVGVGETGTLACRIAFSLPEFFGGVVAIGSGDFLRDEPYLRQRVIERLSVALVANEQDNNRAEMDQLFGPLLQDVGVRAKVWDVADPAEVPGPAILAEIYNWLEEPAPKRRELAQRFPAMHFTGDAAPTREEWARLVLQEGQLRIKSPPTFYSGMMQLRGCATRWEGQDAAAEAGVAYSSHLGPEFRTEEIADLRKHNHAIAKSLTSYLTTIDAAGLHRNLTRNQDWGRKAMRMWEQVANELPDPAEAKKQIAELQKAINRPLPPRTDKR